MRAARVRNAAVLARDWRVALEAAMLTLATKRSLGRGTLAAAAAGRSPARASTPIDATRIAWIVSVVSGRLLGQSCLVNAFVLAALLRRRGVAASVVIGARRGTDGFAAHAWVRSGGATWFEAPAGAYTPLCAVEVAA